MFNSQKINNDPEPYVLTMGIAAMRTDIGFDGTHCYNPRPEFDNNPNPILEDYRAGHIALEDVPWLLGDEWENLWQEHITGEHVDHARRVLEKIGRYL